MVALSWLDPRRPLNRPATIVPQTQAMLKERAELKLGTVGARDSPKVELNLFDARAGRSSDGLGMWPRSAYHPHS
jgi:hypothetical protein